MRNHIYRRKIYFRLKYDSVDSSPQLNWKNFWLEENDWHPVLNISVNKKHQKYLFDSRFYENYTDVKIDFKATDRIHVYVVCIVSKLPSACALTILDFISFPHTSFHPVHDGSELLTEVKQLKIFTEPKSFC